jgi:hypothetical protein
VSSTFGYLSCVPVCSCLALCLLIKDNGLTRPEEKSLPPETGRTETAEVVESDVIMQVQDKANKSGILGIA